MKKIRFKFLVSFIFVLIFSLSAFSWGFFAHKKINRLAVFILPAELFPFYRSNIEFLTEHAVDPDKRRYSDSTEACRHYLDADHYEKLAPLDTIPYSWKDAVSKYSEDTLNAYGIVPWHINRMVYRLTEAFRQKNPESILRNSAELGHYVADAHVPLHSTMNYNGQLSNQHGIHGFWESRLPELYFEEYDLFTGSCRYVSDVQRECFNILNGSFAALDSVLIFERQLNSKFSSDKKYSFEQRGNENVKVYSEEYSHKYHEMLDGMVERRMKESIYLVASLWYTAWVNAGQPDMKEFSPLPDPETDKKLILEEKRFKTKMIDREE